MFERVVPRYLLVLLGIGAVATFFFGLYFDKTGILLLHPYLVNLLSGITGFSTSALIALVVFNRISETMRRRKWEVTLSYVTASVRRRITATSFVVAHEHGLDSDEFDLENVAVRVGRYQFMRTPSLAVLEERLQGAAWDMETVWSILSEERPSQENARDWIAAVDRARNRLAKRYRFLSTLPYRSVASHMDRALGDLVPRLMEITQSPEFSEATYRLDNDYMEWEDYRYDGSMELLLAAVDECLVLLASADQAPECDEGDLARFIPAVRAYTADIKSSKTLVNGLLHFNLSLSDFVPTPRSRHGERWPPAVPRRKFRRDRI